MYLHISDFHVILGVNGAASFFHISFVNLCSSTINPCSSLEKGFGLDKLLSACSFSVHVVLYQL